EGGDKGPVRKAILVGHAGGERNFTLSPRCLSAGSGSYVDRFCSQHKLRLPSTDQVDIDLGEQLGVEQRAVLGAAGIVDRIAGAEVVQPVGNARMLSACEQQRVDQPIPGDRRTLDAVELGIDKADV